MADDLENRGPQDRSRINLEQAHELRYWTKELGCSENELRVIVRRVGNSVEAVRRELGKPTVGVRRNLS